VIFQANAGIVPLNRSQTGSHILPKSKFVIITSFKSTVVKWWRKIYNNGQDLEVLLQNTLLLMARWRNYILAEFSNKNLLLQSHFKEQEKQGR
jgi:hypothetical protein